MSGRCGWGRTFLLLKSNCKIVVLLFSEALKERNIPAQAECLAGNIIQDFFSPEGAIHKISFELHQCYSITLWFLNEIISVNFELSKFVGGI